MLKDNKQEYLHEKCYVFCTECIDIQIYMS